MRRTIQSKGTRKGAMSSQLLANRRGMHSFVRFCVCTALALLIDEVLAVQRHHRHVTTEQDSLLAI